MSQRHMHFKVNELAHHAAEVFGAKTCINIANMLSTMDDGSWVVAKVPNPNAGLPHWTTTSEVATMDFVSSTSMLLVFIQDRFAIVRSIASFQQVWTSVVFTRYGSLYCSRDLEDVESSQPLYMYANGGHITKKSFAIGPSVARETFYNRRAAVDFDRGSCLLPADQTISSAHLWHDDLHVASIFADPAEPTKVVGLIDWQSTEISPLYFHARQPQIINYVGPTINGLQRLQLPKDWEEFKPSEREVANTLYLPQSLLSFQAKEIQTTYSIFQKKEKISKADAEGAIRGMEAMSSIRESLGDFFPEKGIVKQDNYEEALDALSEMKDRKISKFASNAKEREAWEKEWPFGNLKQNSEVV
ncbi:hypothetical protein COCHEDRAFT_1158921 [Bipolaris maydis C5]|uniref:Aminoglycoside phosphotransferase domain-containing protein n=1 Tax=Cochliobolus heterostrophus (strain C5 / ATCC 48332 / race O) TaxID=701091 RepID=M2UI75_COCH5|nr:hypothetical protein COCHEDRAFT_1158921 [Bipolaris maydis C5]